MSTLTQTVIALKCSGSSGNTPDPTQLSFGEVALNYADGKLFYKKPDTTVGSIYNTVVPGVDKDIVFNDGGVFGSSANLVYDKTTSNLYSSVVTTNELNVSNLSHTTTNTYTTSSTSQISVDTTSISLYRTVKYTMQISSGSSYQSEEIMVLHNGTTPRIIEYGVIYTDNSLGFFDVDIVDDNLRLLFTPTNNVNTLKFIKTGIVV